MSIQITLPQGMQHATQNNRTVQVEGSNVGECLKTLIERYPEIRDLIFDKKGKLLRHMEIFVNKETSYPEELAKPVKDGDELYIVNIIAGG